MKRLIILSFIYISVAVAQTDTLRFGQHKFIYQLSDAWGAPKRSQSQGYLDISYKRAVIFDSKRVKIIPNLLIKLVKLNLDTLTSDSGGINIFTEASILKFAPPEVLDDYKQNINLASEYGLNIKNSYGFNSPYTDGYKTRHTCLYFTIFDEKRYGVFICLDSTEEVFEKIRSEVKKFLESIIIK